LDGKNEAAASLGLADTESRIAVNRATPPAPAPKGPDASPAETTARSASSSTRAPWRMIGGAVLIVGCVLTLILRAPRGEPPIRPVEAAAAAVECAHASECAGKHGGEAYACNAGRCVALES